MRTVILLSSVILLFSCNASNDKEQAAKDEGEIAKEEATTVIRKDTLGLIVLYPQYSSIDLVCGTMPSKSDSSVILFAEAAYTGELLNEFKHSNVAGEHVSQGKRYKGFKCKRNTGAFVYYGGKWEFCYKDYSQEIDKAAENGGAAFGQEMIIHKGKLVEIARKDNNKNLGEIYLEAPVRAKLYIPLGSKVDLYIFGGPVASVNLVSGDFHTKQITNNYQANPNLRRFDLLLGGGVGVEIIRHIRATVGYDHGPINRDGTPGRNVHTGALKVAAYYMF